MSTSNKFIAAGLLTFILILITILSGLFSWKFDFTEGKIYTLSEGSETIIEKLEEPVTITLYFNRSIKELPIHYKNYSTRVEEMLRQYEEASKGMIKLNIIDPKPDTQEEEQAIASGIQGNRMSNGGTLYFGISITLADKVESIPFLNTQKESFLEYDITKALYDAQQWDKPIVAVLTDLPILGTPTPPMQLPGHTPAEKPWLFIEQLQTNFEVVQITSHEDWPETIDVLLVYHPVNVSLELLKKIDAHIIQGKPSILCLDPASYFEKADPQKKQMLMQGQIPPGLASDLGPLLIAYQIDYDPNLVIVDPDNGAIVGNSQGQQLQLAHWLKLGADGINNEELISSQLDSLHIIEAGAFSKSEESEYSFIPLVSTSSSAGLYSSTMIEQSTANEIVDNMASSKDPLHLAAFIRGKLNSAYPDETDTPTNTDKANILLIGDTDWLFDSFVVREIFGGYNQTLNDNLNFMGNAVEFMSGSQDLISIRPKGQAQKTFTVVEDIRINAQQEYQKKYDEVNKEVTQLETRINEIREQQTSSGALTLPADLQKEIEEFNARVVDKKAERREIRKNMREDVASLGTTITVLNLTIVPLIVIVTGVIFLVMRHIRK